MIVLILLIIVLLLLIVFLSIVSEEEFGVISICTILLTIFLISCSIALGKFHPESTTSIINKYKQGDYQLELKIDKDNKIDTLYVFK